MEYFSLASANTRSIVSFRFSLPPYTPEMNPIEQIWKEARKHGFKNEAFQTLGKVIDRLCDTICSLSHNTVKSITARDWIDGII